jgi:multiple sugar transport system permease protein
MTTQAATTPYVEAQRPVPSQVAYRTRQFIIYGLLLFGAALVLIPFLWMLSTSLKTQDQLFLPGLHLIPQPAAPENYIDVWTKLSSIAPGMTFWRIISNTLFITLLAMFGEIFSASIVAYGFARFRWKGRDQVLRSGATL